MKAKAHRAGARPTSQRQVAAAAGLSKHQEKQAVRVANIPTEEFEALVESERPPTVTALAELGVRRVASTSGAAAHPHPAPKLETIGRLTLVVHELTKRALYGDDDDVVDAEAAAKDRLFDACELYLLEQARAEKKGGA